MSWTEKSRSLKKKLENVQHIGKRIEVIRACRSGIPGEEGFGKRDFLAKVCGEDAATKKAFKQFLAGARRLKLSSPIVQKAIEVLEVPQVMVGKEEEPAPPPPQSTSDETPKRRTKRSKTLNLRVHNHLRDINVNLLAGFNPSTGELTLHILDDMPISKELKRNKGSVYREVWVPRVTRKFEGTNQEQVIINEESTSL
jgi:hypothetical protein